MKTLAEIFYDAVQADETLMTAIGGRVVSTCFEVPPDQTDNTELPNIIISNDGFQNNSSTKDCVWESDEDAVQASFDVAASSPYEVDSLVARVRRAIETYIVGLYRSGHVTPELQQGSPSSQGIEWDWVKPCYHQTVTYQCVTQSGIYDEQEE